VASARRGRATGRRGRGDDLIKRYLWWWVGVLVVFVIAAKITGNGSLAWSIAEYTSLSVCGIVLLLVLVSGLRDAKEKRRGSKRDE
jgi:hypothetical protein